MKITNATAVAAAVARRHRELASILSALDAEACRGPSLVPDWNRLTVISHLRYGAEANLAMTEAVLAGKTASFYPQGRTVQRPITLKPRPGEQAADVIRSLATTSARLDALWASLNDDQWELVAREPAANVDLGSTTLGFLALLRLTEVEVHGTDLDVGASDWSAVFVDTALPMRVRWLATRRSNHSRVDNDVQGTWILDPHDATPFVISATEADVSITEGSSEEGDARIAGPKRDLLGFLLGRTPLARLSVAGDHELAAAFKRVFPSP